MLYSLLHCSFVPPPPKKSINAVLELFFLIYFIFFFKAHHRFYESLICKVTRRPINSCQRNEFHLLAYLVITLLLHITLLWLVITITCYFLNSKCIFEQVLWLSFVRVCLQLVGWSSGRRRKPFIYFRSVSRTSRDPFRYPSDPRTHLNTTPLNWMLSECVITSPHRYGVNYQMALVQSTSSQEWEDSCRLCCLVTLASGQLSILPPCSKSSDAKIHILCFFFFFF